MNFTSLDFIPLVNQPDLEDGVSEMSRLRLAHPIEINGAHHHVEAIEVLGPDPDGTDMRQADGGDEVLNAYWDINGDNPRTVEIEGLPGRRYFIMLYPYAD